MQLLNHIDISKILFLDIETVPMNQSFSGLSPSWQQLWEKKAKSLTKEDINAADLFDRAAIYAEFGKVVCISVGNISGHPNDPKLRIKCFYGDDEKQLLQEFAQLLNQYFFSDTCRLCAHNGKEFDFPYLSRRMLVHGIKLPNLLDNAGKKPWEIHHIDTMELWKFGDFKSFTSLNLLAHLFGIPTPKDDIDGSMVADVYYRENDLLRIVKYCNKDVVTLVQLVMKFMGKETLDEEAISFPEL